jgi:hypothetical protein
LGRSRGPEAFNEHVRGRLAAASQGEVQNQLRAALNGDETVGVANAFVVGFRRQFVGLLLVDVAPDLIALNIAHRDVHYHPAHELFALLADQHQ